MGNGLLVDNLYDIARSIHEILCESCSGFALHGHTCEVKFGVAAAGKFAIYEFATTKIEFNGIAPNSGAVV